MVSMASKMVPHNNNKELFSYLWTNFSKTLGIVTFTNEELNAVENG